MASALPTPTAAWTIPAITIKKERAACSFMELNDEKGTIDWRFDLDNPQLAAERNEWPRRKNVTAAT